MKVYMVSGWPQLLVVASPMRWRRGYGVATDNLDQDVTESPSDNTVDDEVDARVDGQAEVADGIDGTQRVQWIINLFG